MAADRIYEDTYGPTLEFDVNDVSVERNILNQPAVQQAARAHGGLRVLEIDCKWIPQKQYLNYIYL